MNLITNSFMTMDMNCQMKAHYRYELGLEKKNRGTALPMGSAFHRGMELLNGGVDLQDAIVAVKDEMNVLDTQNEKWLQDIELNKVIVEAMLTGVNQHWEIYPTYKQEFTFKLPIINPETGAKSKTFLLAGKADKIVGGGDYGDTYFLEEYKTTSETLHDGEDGKIPDYVKKLGIDRQITLYMYAVQRYLGISLESCIYRIVRKPSIRQTKKETFEQYRDRLINDYLERPDFYFREVMVTRTDQDLKQFEQELWHYTQRKISDRQKGILMKNTDHCLAKYNCPYLPLCRGEEGADQLYEYVQPHGELDDINPTEVA